MNILLLEDDTAIAAALETFLTEKGCRVTCCASLSRARSLHETAPARTWPYWTGICPTGKAQTLCQELRQRWPRLPLLLLTVRSDTPDILAGFDRGADDYVTKPFDREVLYARLLALWRRNRSDTGETLCCGDIRLDPSRQAVTRQGEPVALAPLEYQLLYLLLQNKGRTMTRQQLLNALWDRNGHFVNDNTLTVTMKRLREKLGRPACLKTVRSFGYRLEEPQS